LPIIESGPSVGNASLDLLHKLGCSPVLIVGFDLSYTYDKLYCDGTQFNQDMKNTNTMVLVDNAGSPCKTEPSFLSMRNWFTEYAGRVSPVVYNCTERGLPIHGIENKKLEDFTFDKNYDLVGIIDNAYYKDGAPDFIKCDYAESNKNLISDLETIKTSIKNNGIITLEDRKSHAWIMVEEFSHAMIYLEEIRCEDRIKKGVEKAESITLFQKRRQELIIETVDKLINMLT